MLNMNRVTLLGHAGRDPEIRTIGNGEKTAAFSLATTDRWRRREGGTGKSTEWHRIVVFGAAVEAVEKLVRKGSALLIEGRIASREYQDKNGGNRRVTEIVVAGPQGLVNVLSPRRDDRPGEDRPAEDNADAAETGDPGGTTDAPVQAGEADGATPDGLSGTGGQG